MIDLSKDTMKVEMFCETGKIGQISNFGVGQKNEIDDEIDYVTGSFCPMTLDPVNQQVYEATCVTNQYCMIEKFIVNGKAAIEDCRAKKTA